MNFTNGWFYGSMGITENQVPEVKFMTTFTQNQNREIAAVVSEFAAYAADLYDHMAEKPVCRPEDAGTLEKIRHQEIPASGRPLREVYEEMLREIYASAPTPQHPRSFACVPSTASLLSWAGDVMTNAFNPHDSCRVNAPAAAEVERKLIRWMCDLAGYPAEGGGLFVSGGSIANLTALTAARDARLTWEERRRAVIYLSGQTHVSVAKGLHIIGFDRSQIRAVPADGRFRMDMAALSQAVAEDLAAGKQPFAVVASAGTTNTGSVDPLTEIAALCQKYGMWMHVDGAFGASALLSAKQRRALAGIELSDSLSWDAHKWMMQTYGCSMVLVRDQSDLVRSFAAHPEYLRDSEAGGDGVEFWDLGPELTRPARCLKLWLTLQTLGAAAMGEMIDHGCTMAELAEKEIRRLSDWEIVSGAQLGIVNFRCAPVGMSPQALDELNRRIAQEITSSGYAQIFTTQLHGRTVLRMCAINPRTTAKDIRETVRRLARSQALRRRAS